MTQQSSCGTCGRPVVWGRRADRSDKYCPPLDAMTAHTGSFIDDQGIARQVTVYQGHRCEPADVEGWLAVVEAREHAKVLAERARLRAEALPKDVTELDDDPDDLGFDMSKYEFYPGGNAWGLPPGINCVDFECKRCKAQPGEPCWSMALQHTTRGEKRAIKGPHETRLFLAGVQQHYINGQYVQAYEDYARRKQINLQDFI